MAPNYQAIESASECISAYDEKLFITMWNPACEKKFNIKAEDAIGKPLLELFPYIRANDHRIVAFRSSQRTKKSFFFPNMIYQYLTPVILYTQYIRPIDANHVISIVKDHEEEARFTPADFKRFFLQ